MSAARPRGDDPKVAEGHGERCRHELAGGGRAPHRGHPEKGGHQDVRDELDLVRHDPDVQRSGDLRRERRAAADEDREHHRDGGERDEEHRDVVARDERAARRGQHDEREGHDRELAVVDPGLLRVALDEERENAGDEQGPDDQAEGALPVDARIHEAEGAQLLELLGGHDLALADDDLAQGHLHLHRGYAVARRLLRRRGRRRVEGPVGLEELLQQLGADAFLTFGPARRERLRGLGARRVELLGPDALRVQGLEGGVELLAQRLELGDGHVQQVRGERGRERDVGEPRERRDPLVPGLGTVRPDPGDRAQRAGELRARRDDHRGIGRVHALDRSRGLVALGGRQGLRHEHR